jgi:hypothetical protein
MAVLPAYSRREQTGAAMSAETAVGESRCWCCGQTIPEGALVHLCDHPEVGMCINCVHWLRRRARDYQATVLRQRLRGAAESIRREDMARGLARAPGDRAPAQVDQRALALVAADASRQGAPGRMKNRHGPDAAA